MDSNAIQTVSEITYNNEKYTLNSPLPSNVVESFKCGICTGILYKPVKVCQESHSFCKQCIEEWTTKYNGQNCPSCRNVLTRNASNIFEANQDMSRMIDQIFIVNCPKECGQTVALGNLEEHNSKFCPKRIVVCKAEGCNKEMPALELDRHRSEECAARPVTCRLCQASHPDNARKRHLSVACSVYPKQTRFDEVDIAPGEIIEYLRQELSLALKNQAPPFSEASGASEVPDGLSNLFNFDHRNELLQQLKKLKAMNASIAGIPIEKFNQIARHDLSTGVPNLIFSEDCLIVLGGEHKADINWVVLMNATFIGSRAPVKLGNGAVIYPDIPETLIKVENMKHNDNWCENDYITNLSPFPVILNRTHRLGYIPAVMLRHGNLVGVKIDCNHMAQGILAAYGTPTIAYCEVENSARHGITLYGVEDYTCQHNKVTMTPGHTGGIGTIIKKDPD